MSAGYGWLGMASPNRIAPSGGVLLLVGGDWNIGLVRGRDGE